VIRASADVPDGFQVRTDVCVIGSGAGGGVAAALFAEAGREVVVLEEGQHVPKERMTQREEEMYPLLYRDGGNQYTADGAIAVLQGRVLGGSTVVNMADVVGVPEQVLAHWARSFGVDRYGLDDVERAAEACKAAIGANRIDEASANRNNSLLLAGGRKLGLSGGTFEHNRVGCTGSGYCLVGCAYDAKRSVALTWIPRAVATGRALVQTEARVDRLLTEGGRVRAAVGHLVEAGTARDLAPFRVEADRFALAAGTIHSPLLLRRSGLGGRQVGRNLSLQPQAAVAALFPEEVVAFRGVPQSTFLDSTEVLSAEEGLGGFRLEGVSVGPGMSAASTSLSGPALHAFLRDFRLSAACLCLVPDRPAGRVVEDRHGRPKISYELLDPWKATMREALSTAARAYLAAGARGVLLPLVGSEPVTSEADLAGIDRFPIRPNSLALISAHPQGSCRMGREPGRSVVGLDLRVHGVENLQVLDASVFPTTASSHTMLPVMTFAVLGASEGLG
jgi:choline dehydrogenase-like flavoprotein